MSIRFQFAIGFILLACAALWTLSPPVTVQSAEERSATVSIAFTKLPDPAVLPVGSTLGAAFSHDSAYLAVGVTHTMPNEPHLLYHGDQDPMADVEGARLISTTLTEQGVDHAYLEVNGDGHCNLDYGPVIQFMAEHLSFETAE